MNKLVIAAGTVVAADRAYSALQATAGSRAGLLFLAAPLVRNASLTILTVAAVKSITTAHTPETTASAA